jgi:hypothetical protein
LGKAFFEELDCGTNLLLKSGTLKKTTFLNIGSGSLGRQVLKKLASRSNFINKYLITIG